LFKPADLVLHIAYSTLGVYACAQNWFLDGKPLGLLAIWAVATVLLIIGFLAFSQGVFADPTVPHKLSPGRSLAFSFTCSFPCLAFLVALTLYTVQY
jgi:CHASE2 domain-containing sensor protein